MCPAVPAWPCPCKVSRGSLLAGFTCHFLEATLSGGPEGGLSGWPLGVNTGFLALCSAKKARMPESSKHTCGGCQTNSWPEVLANGRPCEGWRSE